MRYFRALLVALMVMGGLAGVTATAADAGVDVSDDVDIIVRSNGIVDINGDNHANHIAICGAGEGELLVIIYGGLEPSYEIVTALTKDLRINMKGGDDRVEINGGACQTSPNSELSAQIHHSIEIPRDLRVILGSGADWLFAYGFHVGDDMTVLGGSGDEGLNLFDFWVEDRMDVNTSSGNSNAFISEATFGRSSFRGGNQMDNLDFYDVDLGKAPRFLTRSGDDRVVAVHTTAEGRITGNLGNGNDIFGWLDGFCDGDLLLCCDDGNGCCVEGPCCEEGSCCEEDGCCGDSVCIGAAEDGPIYYFNLIMGGGDDEAHIAVELDPADRIQGSGGNGDYLGFFSPGGARINGFEFFGDPDPDIFLLE